MYQPSVDVLQLFPGGKRLQDDILNYSMLETYVAFIIFIYVSSYACVRILTATHIPLSTCPEMD